MKFNGSTYGTMYGQQLRRTSAIVWQMFVLSQLPTDSFQKRKHTSFTLTLPTITQDAKKLKVMHH